MNKFFKYLKHQTTKKNLQINVSVCLIYVHAFVKFWKKGWIIGFSHLTTSGNNLFSRLPTLNIYYCCYYSYCYCFYDCCYYFQSCYPPFKELGSPKRRHIITIFMVKAKDNRDSLDKQIKLCTRETDACVWIHETIIKEMANGNIDSKATSIQ